MDDGDLPIQETFLDQAIKLALAGDLSWLKAMEELVNLYDLREANTNNFWRTPKDSPEWENWEKFNQPYLAALNHWDRTWAMVAGNHKERNFITYEMASDFLKLKNLSTD